MSCAWAANADFVKTSTGFVKNGVGAKAEDVELMAAVVKPHGLGVKASAGIRDKEKALAMVKPVPTGLVQARVLQLFPNLKA